MLLQQLLEKKVSEWINQELDNEQSIIGSIIKYINAQQKLRLPQTESLKVYLWLKFVGNNQKLSDIVKQGLLYDKEIYDEDPLQHYFTTPSAQFLSRLIKENDNKKLSKYLIDKKDSIDFDKIVKTLLHDFEYTNYLYSLPMGAGKTYLIASFIYLELYFAKLFKNDKRFAHNFVIFAPHASKTAILPSLKTIKNFNPEWILPKVEADQIRQEITIEILDVLSSQRRDKLQGNNPNLEKVNRLKQQKDYGLVFITNAEKVVLEKYTAEDTLKIHMQQKEENEVKKINKLREGLSQLPNLTIILDEVHHAYGNQKLRQAIDILNQHNHINQVIGVSGTPYVQSSVNIGEHTLKTPTIQDIVYYYGLNKGIGKFLKVPIIKKSTSTKEKAFINKALDDFFTDYDINYNNGTKSKIAFYCPNIETLNTEILPIINKWYDKNRPSNKEEIFIYYSASKDYPLPKDSTAIFHNLDQPYSKKRVILLVAIGTEGWDCKSLTSIVLPRKQSTKNFVLQTTCRCLREVDNASDEKALIYLSEENYQILDNELQTNYKIGIKDLVQDQSNALPVKVRKPKLGMLKYKQVEEKWILTSVSTVNPQELLAKFDFAHYTKTYKYNSTITSARIGSNGLTGEIEQTIQTTTEAYQMSFEEFIYQISSNLYGIIDECTLLMEYRQKLENIYAMLRNNNDWINNNPNLSLEQIIYDIASCFVQAEKYEKEEITSDIEIELLEWNISEKIYITDKDNNTYDLMPPIEKDDIRTYLRTPEFYEEDSFNFERKNIDPLDMSFNYIPYRMDSKLEVNALKSILKQKEFEHLEIYYNGYKDKGLQNFFIKTPYGNYTPDFLILKRDVKYNAKRTQSSIDKILIIETKGKPYYDNFKSKEKFIKDVFVKHNPNFTFICIVDEEGDNNFDRHIETIKELIKNF